MRKAPTPPVYGLWLDADPDGRILLHGWTEPAGGGRTDHWPTYPLCAHPAELPERLAEFGLALAPGADIDDLTKGWDVYLRHENPTALRALLETELTNRASA